MRGLLVGRFQPFHLGHLATVRWIREQRDEPLLLGIGSAQESYTWANPFTAGERFEMIDRTLRMEGISQVQCVPLPDIHRHAQWVAYLEAMLPPFRQVYTNNPLTHLLFERAGYSVEPIPWDDRERSEGAKIRRDLARTGSTEGLPLPKAVAAYLTEIDGAARLRRLRPMEAGGGPTA
ncbi:MAG: nicotinamide-nucleotide adenylyltransferase [Thermoplasmata archaeon]